MLKYVFSFILLAILPGCLLASEIGGGGVTLQSCTWAYMQDKMRKRGYATSHIDWPNGERHCRRLIERKLGEIGLEAESSETERLSRSTMRSTACTASATGTTPPA